MVFECFWGLEISICSDHVITGFMCLDFCLSEIEEEWLSKILKPNKFQRKPTSIQIWRVILTIHSCPHKRQTTLFLCLVLNAFCQSRLSTVSPLHLHFIKNCGYVNIKVINHRIFVQFILVFILIIAIAKTTTACHLISWLWL